MKKYKNKEWLENKYLKEKLSKPQIAKLCGVTFPTIFYWLQKFNIPIRSYSESAIIRCNSENAKYHDKNWLEEKYIKEKLPIIQIGKICGVNRRLILHWLKKLNITRRSRGEATHLATTNHCNLSQRAIEWISGELLGDGCLLSQSPYSARFEYTLKHLEYIEYISSILKSFGIEQSGKMYKKYDKKWKTYSYQYQSHYYEELFPIYKKWYPEGKKIIPKDINLTPLTTMQWYLGDGCLHKPKKANPYIILSTDGFIAPDIKWLVEQLIKLGFKTNISKKLNKFTIRISTYSFKAFLDFIGKCPVQCYQYKFATKGE